MAKIHARFATGDFVGALRLADDETLTADTGAAFAAWLLEQMPVLLTSAGWSRLKLGDCDEATTYLRRAEALKRAPETAKGLAVCYFKQKNLVSAREQFAFYLERAPDDHQMRVLYADTLESEGRYDDAVKALEVAQAALPEEPGLKDRLTSMRGKAKESLSQLVESSRNFRLSYDAAQHEDLVAGVLEVLEEAVDEFVDQYDFRVPPAPIEVILYPAGDFKAVVSYGPEWAEGLFDGRIRIPVRAGVRRAADLSIVLRHELVHALLSLMSDARQLPPWFDEGLAQRLSCAKAGLCGAFEFPPTPGEFLAAPAFQAPYTSFTAVKAGRAYRQSLYLILILESLFGDAGDSLRRVIGRIGPSTSLTSDALLEPLQMTFATLHATAVREWQRRNRLTSRP